MSREEDAPGQGSELTLCSGSESPLLDLDLTLRPGSILNDRYRIEQEIGSGGFAHVYRAMVLSTEAQVAIKVLDPKFIGTQMATRFIREARAIQAIRHPNVVEILDFAVANEGWHHFIVMELLRGQTLRTLLETRGRFTLTEILDLGEQICAALEAAHELVIVHRDIKTGNMMVLPGPQPILKLLDFGVAKFLDAEGSGLTARNQLVGSALTMAPEQICGMPVDFRTDIYSVGVVLFQLATGRYPFRPRDGDIHQLHLTATPPTPSQFAPMPHEFDALVLRCLEKRPENRPQTVDELLRGLRDIRKSAGSGVQVARRSGTAVAIYLELSTEGLMDDDQLLMTMSDVSASAEELLESAGFQLCIRTPSAVLGACPVEVEPGAVQEGEALLGLQAKAASLVAELHGLSPISAQVRRSIRFRTAEAEWDAATGEILGGTLLCPDNWPEDHPAPEASTQSAAGPEATLIQLTHCQAMVAPTADLADNDA